MGHAIVTLRSAQSTTPLLVGSSTISVARTDGHIANTKPQKAPNRLDISRLYTVVVLRIQPKHALKQWRERFSRHVEKLPYPLRSEDCISPQSRHQTNQNADEWIARTHSLPV